MHLSTVISTIYVACKNLAHSACALGMVYVDMHYNYSSVRCIFDSIGINGHGNQAGVYNLFVIVDY